MFLGECFMESVWQASSSRPQFPQLKQDVSVDVLIIGGGIAGILTAYFLQQRGVNYILAEKDRICSGVTENTTAKITVQHGLIYQKILKQKGAEGAKMYLRANQTAFEKFSELCGKIDCDYEKKDNYVYSLNDRKKLENEIEALRKIGYKASYCGRLPIPLKTVGAVRFMDQAQYNPLKFLFSLSKGLNIYENTFVREMVGNTAVTDGGTIRAKKVIVTTHFPFINKHGSYFLKLYQHRSYVIALEKAPDVRGMYVDESNVGLSFRNYNGLLLLGGGGHRTGKQGGNWAEIRTFSRKYYPGVSEKYFWATQDCMSLDGVPYIGQYSNSTQNLYVAAGFNKWGMTSSMVSAMILSDLVTGKRNDYSAVFDPSRSILKPQLFVNGFESVLNLLSPAKKRCPHLGCALKWNPEEHSWDCPCHGSRFSADGKLLDNPANDDLTPDETLPH